MLIKHAEKIKWATWQPRWHPLSASLSLTHQSCRVTKKQWEGGGRRVLGVVLGYFPWRTTLLPFPVHQWQLHWGNSRYQMFGHLLTVVSCQIQQIRAHLAAHGWKIFGIGCRWKCSMYRSRWEAGRMEGGRSDIKYVCLMVSVQINFMSWLSSWRETNPVRRKQSWK